MKRPPIFQVYCYISEVVWSHWWHATPPKHVFPDSTFHFHSFHFYWNSLFFIIFPWENVQHSVFPYFPPWLFRPQVVLYVCMFPTDTLLTEFVKQHLTRHIEVIRKLLGPLFWCKLRVLCFFCRLCQLLRRPPWHAQIVWEGIRSVCDVSYRCSDAWGPPEVKISRFHFYQPTLCFHPCKEIRKPYHRSSREDG